jgi:dihydrofolate reductase
MAKLVYSMMISLDGFIETPRREIDWHVIDEELHLFANQQTRETGFLLYGRRLYEVMAAFWPTADEKPSNPGFVVEYARIWKEIPKVVFSKTLDRVDWNSRLVRDDAAGEIARLKALPGKELAIGGANLAATAVRLGLVDEFRPFVHPVVIGAGTPYLPVWDGRLELRLLETRRFGSGVVYLRYERAADASDSTIS